MESPDIIHVSGVGKMPITSIINPALQGNMTES
jgi:hypothetical protein